MLGSSCVFDVCHCHDGGEENRDIIEKVSDSYVSIYYIMHIWGRGNAEDVGPNVYDTYIVSGWPIRRECL